MKIGVSSYSFIQLVRAGKLDFVKIPEKAKEIGFDVLEFSTIAVPDGETLKEFAAKLREECERVGIPIVNYTIAADFLKNGPERWEEEVERLKGEVEVAKILGVSSMRHDATFGFPDGYMGAKSFDAALPTLVEGCRAVTEYAASCGIRTMVENHGFFCQDSDRVEKLVSAVDNQNFGLLVDMGNFLCVDEDPARAQGRLMPYAFHVHAKDFHVKPGTATDPGDGWFRSRAGNLLRGSIIGHGDVPITQCLQVMKKAGYDHVLSIEFEGLEDPVRGLEIGLANLRSYVSEVYGR